MKYDFIEIGTSDFDTILQEGPSGIGMSIDPLKIYLDKLPERDNFIKVNCAITNYNGFVEVFWIDPEDIVRYELPNWLRGCNSIINPHPSALIELKDRGLLQIYKKSKCRAMNWISLVETYDIKSIDYLKIDTEGHDCIIINDILDSNNLPNKITFENNILSDQSYVEKTLKRLEEKGYRLVNKTNTDIIVQR